ncbi:MAG: hypothetical protein EKK33_01415 [Bradyrhizobiaceae bacterium]|nr:MAG: hypothetical protein EKK33_01415 [Bradyrhizobiaceae bacterium]
MLTNTPSLDKIVAELESQIAEKQAALDNELDEIVQLKMRRERIVGTLKELAESMDGVEPPSRAGCQISTVSRSSKAVAVPGKAAAVIVDALRAAGAMGLSGAELNKKVMDAGLSGAAADKAKTRLKQAQTLTQKDGRWHLRG